MEKKEEDMNQTKKKMDIRVVKYLILIAAFVLAIQYFDVIGAVAGQIVGVISPLILGCIMAYVLNIIMRKLEKVYFPNSKNKWLRASKRPVCILASLALVVAIAAALVELVLPELIDAVTVIVQRIPVVFERLQNWIVDNADKFPEIGAWVEDLTVDWNGLTKNLLKGVTSGLEGFVNSTVTIVGIVSSGIMNSVIGLIFAIYILSNKEALSRQLQKILKVYVKPRPRKEFLRVVTVADDTFSSFIVGQCTEAVILGTLCVVGMMIFRFPYAPMVGTFIGATALIPVVGAYLGATVGAFMILTVSPIKAIFFIIFIVVLQQLEGNLIYPKVVGSSIGLPGIWVLAAVTIGGGLQGIVGMLIGVPLSATIYKLIRTDVNGRLGTDMEIIEVKKNPQGNTDQVTGGEQGHEGKE